jgi:hypothetical protein
MLEGLAESSKAPTLCDAEAHPISSRWTNWPIVSVLELSALYDLGFEVSQTLSTSANPCLTLRSFQMIECSGCCFKRSTWISGV